MELPPPTSQSSQHDIQFKRVTTPPMWTRSHPCFFIYFSVFTSFYFLDFSFFFLHISLSLCLVVFIHLLFPYSLLVFMYRSSKFRLSCGSLMSLFFTLYIQPSVPSTLPAFHPTSIYNFILEHALKTTDLRQLIRKAKPPPRTRAIVTWVFFSQLFLLHLLSSLLVLRHFLIKHPLSLSLSIVFCVYSSLLISLSLFKRVPMFVLYLRSNICILPVTKASVFFSLTSGHKSMDFLDYVSNY